MEEPLQLERYATAFQMVTVFRETLKNLIHRFLLLEIVVRNHFFEPSLRPTLACGRVYRSVGSRRLRGGWSALTGGLPTRISPQQVGENAVEGDFPKLCVRSTSGRFFRFLHRFLELFANDLSLPSNLFPLSGASS